MINTKKLSNLIGENSRKLAALHFFYAFALSVQLIAFDAGKLITPEVTMRRWLAIAVLLFVTSTVWYVSKDTTNGANKLKKYIGMLILTDIALAAFYVYLQRGMASRAVLLFTIPIIVSAVLQKSSALIATATVCIAAYVATTVSYFVLNFNEGYKLELYGEVGFYCAMFILIALLTRVFLHPPKNS